MRNRKIFLVDDESEILEVYQAILAAQFDVTCFTSPQELIKTLEAGERPDMFVTDMKMPGMTGAQLIQWARKSGIEHPFVIVSGYAERSEAIDILRLGAVELLEKPFSMDVFRLMVQRSLTHRLHQEIRAKAVAFAKLTEGLVRGLAPEALKQFQTELGDLREIDSALTEVAGFFKPTA